MNNQNLNDVESIEHALSALHEIYPTIDWDNENIVQKIEENIEENIDEIEEAWDRNEAPHDLYWQIVRRYVR